MSHSRDVFPQKRTIGRPDHNTCSCGGRMTTTQKSPGPCSQARLGITSTGPCVRLPQPHWGFDSSAFYWGISPICVEASVLPMAAMPLGGGDAMRKLRLVKLGCLSFLLPAKVVSRDNFKKSLSYLLLLGNDAILAANHLLSVITVNYSEGEQSPSLCGL